MSKRLTKLIDYVNTFDFTNIPGPLRFDDEPIGKNPPDELDILAAAINRMRDNLELSYDVLSQLNQNLEAKVQDNTQVILEQRQKLEYAAKMTALGEMAGGVAHEINTPLATILLNAEILSASVKSDQPDLKRLRTSAHSIMTTVGRIAKIVTGLRTFSRDSAKDPMSTVALHTLCEDTFSLCRERFANKGVDLQFNPGDSALSVECRPVEICQVLLNLMNNSYDAVRDLPEKWIRVVIFERDDMYEISVTDSGKGISAEIQAKMGQPFFTTKGIGGGTGLGLSISQGILRSHGGTLELDKSSAHTSFVIRLPKSQSKKITEAA